MGRRRKLIHSPSRTYRIRYAGETVTIHEVGGDDAKRRGAWTYFDEKNRWTRQIYVYKDLPANEKKRLIAHELAEGLSGIGRSLPPSERHKRIQPLEKRIMRNLK